MSAPLVIIQHSSPIPSYEQIGSQIRAAIVSGQLRPGDRLPSVRQMAKDLNVAPNTIVRAYSELERGGWVTMKTRQGVMIAELADVALDEERSTHLRRLVQEMLFNARMLGISMLDVRIEVDRQIITLTEERG